VNPRNDTLPDLINYLGQFAVDFLRTAGISCQVDLPNHPPALPVTSETRHSLYLVVKETLNNIARHAHASDVKFNVEVSNQSVRIVIADNGRGFRNGEADAFADGVGNMRLRMEEIGGEFRVESVAEKGTRVELVFRQPKN
jgi:signal transduction histidine kinase